MRYLILTDIHGNLEALNACIEDASARGYDRALVLGDLVGYGGDPNEVIERVRSLNPLAIVRGNHDKVACGLEPADGFNAVAKSAVRWTYETLTVEHREWLAALPKGPHAVSDFLEICHGSPFDEDAYIFDELDAARALKESAHPLCLFGHTHFPAIFELSAEGLDMARPIGIGQVEFPLQDEAKYLINPGAVGQPRDGDPRAAYAIVDENIRRIDLFRLNYAIDAAQARIITAGLPEVLAQRLAVGR
jgi:diadenosine tetraphosphatase ApaH/serine/threonine PP2A family protein phosphatase